MNDTRIKADMLIIALLVPHANQVAQEILGTVFETAVFAEFVKTRGSKDLFFWRTQGKQEIDFILRKPDGLVPYEVKLRFEQWNRSSMKYFCDRYGIEECYCVGLEGDVSARERIFPWQI